jgi:MoxR-like ATPase
MPSADVTLKDEAVVQLMGTVRDMPIAEHVERYAANLLIATHPESDRATPMVKQYGKYGASPRGLQAMVLGGKVRALLDRRFNVAEDDIRAVAKPALRHRILLNFEGEAEEISTDAIVDEIIEKVTVNVS